MPFPKKHRPLVLSDEERRKLKAIGKSRTEEKRRIVRAAVLLDSCAGRSDQAIAHRIHQYFEEVNADPVVFRWKYKLDEVVVD